MGARLHNMAATRLLVERRCYDGVVAGLAARAQRQRLGDSCDPETEMGSLTSVAQRDRVEHKLIRRSSGAEIVAERTFGPAFTVQRFDDEAGALAMANSTPYGLAASLCTHDIGRAMRTGTVWVNDYPMLTSDVPVTGFGQSGFDTENGEQGLLSLTRLEHLAVSPS